MAGIDNPIDKIDEKQDGCIRFVLFNINGINTLGNYFPWNQFNNYNQVFLSLKADVISLQELKLTTGNLSKANLTNLKNYKSFISLPKYKKGYSGVGLFVRTASPDDSVGVKNSLNVLKAEEGITGLLKDSDGVKYKDSKDSIGGYVMPDEDKIKEFENLDQEGRAVVVEFATGLVVFLLYCPANSMGTEEGESFKNLFMDVLIRRCQNLVKQGKQILILGDINISLNLIDQADGINERLNKKLITFINDGDAFELLNGEECLKFKLERYSRFHLNQFVNQTVTEDMKEKFTEDTQFLYDTTREIQGRKLGLYTCWNTMNGSRQTNYGSRIDLILTSSEWKDKVIESNIWPFLMGSDHCPVFTDFRVDDEMKEETATKKLKFEASTFYRIGRHHDISSMFQLVKKRKIETGVDSSTTSAAATSKVQSTTITTMSKKPEYKSRKIKPEQMAISSFFSSKQIQEEQLAIEASIKKKASQSESESSSQSSSRSSQKMDIKSAFGDVPTCNHGKPCQLKTSLNNPKTRGKKFWCCSIASVGLNDGVGEGRCSFFQWLNPR